MHLLVASLLIWIQLPENYDLASYDQIDSTNSELCRLLDGRAVKQKSKPLAVVAYSQTAGRGRLGRNWESASGGLYLSINLNLSGNAQKDAALSLIVALGVYEAFRQIMSDLKGRHFDDIKIKWPNDLVCPTGKLSGILLETYSMQEVIVGIGINVQRSKSAFEGAAYLSDFISPEQATKLPELLKIADVIITSIIASHNKWQEVSFEFSSFVDLYNKKLNIIDSWVTVRDISGNILASGIARGVDVDGKLLVQEESGITSIVSGDVTLRNF
jgi:BirA family biotin operon repressor/biotin-[acetyl-CoA-carboxylase] ligase